MKSVLFAAAIVLALTPAWALAQEADQDAEGLLAQAVPAVVTVVAYDANSQPVAQGSGFFVSSDGLLVTCYHVISEAVSAGIVLSDGTQIAVTGMCEGLPDKDLALLKVDLNDAAFLPVAEQETAVGDKAFVIGSPESLASTVSDGLVSGYRPQEDGPTLLQTSAPISAGSSGGPVLNSAGEVIGVTTSAWRFGNDLNFAVPARYVRGLLLIAEQPGPLPADPAGDLEASERTGTDEACLTRAGIIAQLPEGVSPYTLNESGGYEGWTIDRARLVTLWGQENILGERMEFVAAEGSDIRLQIIGDDNSRVRLDFHMASDGLLPGMCEIDATLDAESVANLAARDKDAELKIVGRVVEFSCGWNVAHKGIVEPGRVILNVTLEDCEIGQPPSPDESEDNEQELTTESEPEPVDDETAAGRALKVAELYRASEMPEWEREKLMDIIALYPETEAATKARERIEQMDAEPQDAAGDSEDDE